MQRDQFPLGLAKGVRIPPPGRLTPTSPVDAVSHYHGFGYGAVLRRRLRWVLDALPKHRVDSVLEIGYGSGIFFSELASRCKRLVGIDVHPHGARTRRELEECGIDVTLLQADATALPFADLSFDVVISVSTLEFVPDPARALLEAFRVTQVGGSVIAITPRPMAWADRIYSQLVGFDPESDFRGGRSRVQQALASVPLPITRQTRPRGFPATFAPYERVVIRRPVLADITIPERRLPLGPHYETPARRSETLDATT